MNHTRAKIISAITIPAKIKGPAIAKKPKTRKITTITAITPNIISNTVIWQNYKLFLKVIQLNKLL